MPLYEFHTIPAIKRKKEAAFRGPGDSFSICAPLMLTLLSWYILHTKSPNTCRTVVYARLQLGTRLPLLVRHQQMPSACSHAICPITAAYVAVHRKPVLKKPLPDTKPEGLKIHIPH